MGHRRQADGAVGRGGRDRPNGPRGWGLTDPTCPSRMSSRHRPGRKTTSCFRDSSWRSFRYPSRRRHSQRRKTHTDYQLQHECVLVRRSHGGTHDVDHPKAKHDAAPHMQPTQEQRNPQDPGKQKERQLHPTFTERRSPDLSCLKLTYTAIGRPPLPAAGNGRQAVMSPKSHVYVQAPAYSLLKEVSYSASSPASGHARQWVTRVSLVQVDPMRKRHLSWGRDTAKGRYRHRPSNGRSPVCLAR